MMCHLSRMVAVVCMAHHGLSLKCFTIDRPALNVGTSHEYEVFHQSVSYLDGDWSAGFVMVTSLGCNVILLLQSHVPCLSVCACLIGGWYQSISRRLSVSNCRALTALSLRRPDAADTSREIQLPAQCFCSELVMIARKGTVACSMASDGRSRPLEDWIRMDGVGTAVIESTNAIYRSR